MKNIQNFFTLMLLAMLSINSNSDALEPISVSLVNLISTPEKYNDKKINVSGYAVVDWEGGYLFLHEDDYRNVILNNSVRLKVSCGIENKKLNNFTEKYVLVKGVFDASDKGQFNLSGSVRAYQISIIGKEADKIDKKLSVLDCTKEK